MNILDIILLIIIVFFLSYSIIKGATRTIFRILAITSGYFAAYHLSYIFSPCLGRFIAKPVLRDTVASFIIFILVFFGFILLGAFFYFLIKSLKLKLFDRIIGGLVGISLGFGIGWITVMIFLLFFNLQTPLFKNSKFSVYFLKFGNISTKYLPKEWTNPIKESYNDYKKYVEAIRNPPKIEEILKELQ